LIEPLRNIFGVSDKVLNMTLAYLLTSAPPNKALWLETGTHMNAVDTLDAPDRHTCPLQR
jgi:hypothetical protein